MKRGKLSALLNAFTFTLSRTKLQQVYVQAERLTYILSCQSEIFTFIRHKLGTSDDNFL